MRTTTFLPAAQAGLPLFLLIAFLLISLTSNLGAQEGITNISEINGKVWQDPETDVNGIFDAQSDLRLPDIAVALEDDDGNQIDLIVTDSAGCYKFIPVAPGSYVVLFNIPDHLSFVMPNQGESEDFDSDVTDLINGRTDVIFVGDGVQINGVNAGLRMRTLAVNFMDFSVSWNDEKAMTRLNWSVANQTNTQFFRVHRADDIGSVMKVVGELKITQENSNQTNFSFDDTQINKEGTYYYQIEELDADGLSTLSRIESVRIQADLGTPIPLVTYPNPAENKLIAIVRLENAVAVGFRLFDMQGRSLHIWNDQNLDSGKHTISLDLPDLPEGQYILRAEMGSEAYSQMVQVY